MKKIIATLALGSLLGSLALVGCSEAERTYDCAQICDTYATCIDSDLDKTDCVDACEDRGEADADFQKKVDDCEACLDDQDCASSTVGCVDECAEVIARSALGQGGAQD